MIKYLNISLITLCFCRITYLWVRHKRENKREVALADELIEDENGINIFLEEKENFLPKKMMKAHTLEEPIGYSGENVMGEERAREWEEGLRERRRREQRMMVKRWGVLGNLERRGGVWKLR